jgi:hypothetical protein
MSATESLLAQENYVGGNAVFRLLNEFFTVDSYSSDTVGTYVLRLPNTRQQFYVNKETDLRLEKQLYR